MLVVLLVAPLLPPAIGVAVVVALAPVVIATLHDNRRK
jgi:hypothetical protein